MKSCKMSYGMPYMNYGMDFNEEGLKRSICLIKKALQGEAHDAMEYNYLCCKAPTKSQKDIIKSIRCDEINHRKWFREIYREYTGKCADDDFCECECECKKLKSYKEGIKEAILSELTTMEQYRLIRSGLPDRCYRDLVFQILTDEMKHAIKFNYILTELYGKKKKYKYKCKCRSIDDIYNDDMDDINDDLYDDIDDIDDLTDDLDDDMDDLDINTKSNDSNKELIKTLNPLIDRALQEEDMGINSRYLFSKFILSGALVGKGEDAEEALKKVERWQEDEDPGIFIRNNNL